MRCWRKTALRPTSLIFHQELRRDLALMPQVPHASLQPQLLMHHPRNSLVYTYSLTALESLHILKINAPSRGEHIQVVHTRVTFLGTLDTGFLQGNMAASPTAQHHQPQEPCLRTGHLHPVERYASTGWHRPPATQITKQLRLLFRITIRRSVHRCKHQRNPFMGLKATKFANVLIARAKP